MPPPVGRDAFIHGDSGEPRSRVLVAQTADPLPGLEEGFLDGILRQGLVAKDQAGRPEQLKAVPVNHLLKGVAIAVPPPLDDASEHRIHEHANPIDAPGAVTG